MSQGEPVVHVVVEEAQDDEPALITALAKLWIQHVAERRKEPPAISEKNANQGGVTARHVAPACATSFRRDSHARSVFMVTDLPSPMGQRVRLRRAELGWHQKDLAKKAGVGYRTIQRLETNGVMPRPVTAHKIATALGRTIAWLEGVAEGAHHGDDRSEGDSS